MNKYSILSLNITALQKQTPWVGVYQILSVLLYSNNSREFNPPPPSQYGVVANLKLSPPFPFLSSPPFPQFLPFPPVFPPLPSLRRRPLKSS